MPPLILLALLASFLWSAPPARADSHRPAEGRVGCPHCRNDGSEISRWLERADALYAEFKPREALREAQKVLEEDPDHHEALSKSSRFSIDIGDAIPESEPDWRDKRLRHYRIAEDYARRAVKANPSSTWGYFYVAASLGKIAMYSPVSTQIELAREIQTSVEKAIQLDPKNGYAYHIYGVWHRRVAEIGQMKRFFSSLVLGRSIPEGSMEKSAEYLTRAVTLNPTVIWHRLELARTHLALGNPELARSALKAAQQLPIQFSDDAIHKQDAERLLRQISSRP
jgi:tetratricopeptide (TPR) repeat protein